MAGVQVAMRCLPPPGPLRTGSRAEARESSASPANGGGGGGNGDSGSGSGSGVGGSAAGNVAAAGAGSGGAAIGSGGRRRRRRRHRPRRAWVARRPHRPSRVAAAESGAGGGGDCPPPRRSPRRARRCGRLRATCARARGRPHTRTRASATGRRGAREDARGGHAGVQRLSYHGPLENHARLLFVAQPAAHSPTRHGGGGGGVAFAARCYAAACRLTGSRPSPLTRCAGGARRRACQSQARAVSAAVHVEGLIEVTAADGDGGAGNNPYALPVGESYYRYRRSCSGTGGRRSVAAASRLTEHREWSHDVTCRDDGVESRGRSGVSRCRETERRRFSLGWISTRASVCCMFCMT